jgi:putative acetyltransferase
MMIDDGIIIAAEKPNTPEVRRLLVERDAYFDRLYAGEDQQAGLVDVERDNLVFFSVRTSSELVGCGALLQRDGYGELKRFYISDAHRGRGLGRRLLEAVEDRARSDGYRILRLETGVLQPAAIALYRSAGFSEIGRFGDYVPDPLSIFLEKTL